ncbi:GSCOCG00013544001-RA-CDS, partial [Cotesia congregata]
CLCQPIPTNGSSPIRIDVRAIKECTCECPFSPECACPPSERRFLPVKKHCPNSRLCQPPMFRLPLRLRCRCTKCQKLGSFPVPCNPCTATKCSVGQKECSSFKNCKVDKDIPVKIIDIKIDQDQSTLGKEETTIKRQVSYNDTVEIREDVIDLLYLFPVENQEDPPIDNEHKVVIENKENKVKSCPEGCGARCLRCRENKGSKDDFFKKERTENEEIKELERGEKDGESLESDEWTFVDVECKNKPIKLLKAIDEKKNLVKMNPKNQVFILSLTLISTAITTVKSQQKVSKNSVEGCGECAYYRCPENSTKCLLGSVKDPCNCCKAGKCARLEGETCWNSSISKLPMINRNEGYCSNNYRCLLRDDLLEQDSPEAICVCMEQSPACGSNNITYATPCALHEEAIRVKNKSLKLKHLGPCLSRPWILAPLDNLFVKYGQRLAINCEAKGFPIPDIFWEFHSTDGRVIRLPSNYIKKIKFFLKNYYGSTVNTREESEQFMRTSWMQVGKMTRDHIGTYQCIANNSIGDVSSESIVSTL